MSIHLPTMPPQIGRLRRDKRGYPVPWFVAWVNGEPEFRAADQRNLVLAIKERRCWVCGSPISGPVTFVIGPMCAINRTSAEPPSHMTCAVFSAKACPFLSMPKAHRRESNLPPEAVDPAGEMIRLNPGVTLLWTCKGYGIVQVENGVLFELRDPIDVQWFCEGRGATRDEIMASIDGGLPILQGMAEQESPDAVAELQRMVKRGLKLVPA